MSITPQTQAGKEIYQTLTNLSKELKFYDGQFKAMRKLRAKLNELDTLKDGVSSATSSVKTLEKQFGGTQKIIDVLNKDVKDGKVLWDTFLKKVPGYGSNLFKAAKASTTLGSFLAIGGVAGIVALIAKWQGEINEASFATDDSIQADLTRVNSLAAKVGARVRANNARLDKLVQEDQRTRDRVYGLEKQLVPVRDKANDALYEVRQGRTILEGKIADVRKYANDALAESRGTAQKINAQIQQQNASFTKQIADINAKIASFVNGTKSNFEQTINTTINGIKAEIATLKAKPPEKVDVAAIIAQAKNAAQQEIAGLKNQVSLLANTLGNVASKVTGLDFQLGAVDSVARGAVQASDNALRTANAALKEANTNKFPDLLPSLNNEINKKFDEFVKQNNADLKIRDLQQSDLSKRFEQQFEDFKRLSKADSDTRFNEFIRSNREALNGTKREIQSDLGKLDLKIKEQERVNEKGNEKLDQIIPKLDQIIPTLAGIPLIPGRTADILKPSIPTIPQIENATGTAMCRNLKTGCGKQAIDEAVGNVVGNNNQNTNAVLNALGAGGSLANLATNLALLPSIDSKLGEQIPGGIGGKLSKLGKWLQFDRIFGMLTLAATIHNGVMLSNDIGTTLVGALTNVLTGLGLTDEDGAGIDFGKIIGSSVESFIQSIIGAANYNRLVDAWAKANRIYQATTNVLNSFLNLSQTILQASELIAAYTGRIGNALRKSGVILENAYGWMNPQPKFNRVTKFLEGLQTTASTVQMVTQVPLDVINATTEFTTASTDFVKAIKEDDKPENKTTPTPEPDELKAKETQSKTDSQPLDFDFSDLFDGED